MTANVWQLPVTMNSRHKNSACASVLPRDFSHQNRPRRFSCFSLSFGEMYIMLVVIELLWGW